MYDKVILFEMMGYWLTDRDDLGSLDWFLHMHWGRLWPNTKTTTITYLLTNYLPTYLPSTPAAHHQLLHLYNNKLGFYIAPPSNALKMLD